MQRIFPASSMGHVAVDVTYDGRPDGLVFVVGDKRLQHVYVRNSSACERVMAKIQSTSSRKFRVRPGFAVLAPHESVAVQIQLAPNEREASESKFLLVVRRVVENDDAVLQNTDNVTTTRRGSTAAEQAQQQRDAEDKAMWQRADARHEESLVLSETIVTHIVLEQCTKTEVTTLLEPTCTAMEFRPTNDTAESNDAIAIPLLRTDSLETRAHVVALLMKNQSRLRQNQLTADERTALRRLQEEISGTEWATLDAYAGRMRVLARQYAAARRLPQGTLT